MVNAGITAASVRRATRAKPLAVQAGWPKKSTNTPCGGVIHVRVDVLYVKLSRRGKAIADIISSVFFYIFVGTMLWTGARFALDAINVQESSFTEWGIQYWPVKLAIPVGAFLIALQGLSRLIKDILLVTGRRA